MKTKFAIGCLVQWYEVDIIEEYIETLKEAIDEYDGEVIVEFCVVEHEILENCITPEKKQECLRLIEEKLLTLNHLKTTIWSGQVMYSIADYRRQFNEKYCEQADVLVWGESDMLVPKQTFNILDNLHQMSLQNNNPKYLAFFGTCKMWDQSWEMLEHPDFTIKPHIDNDYDNWWSLKYTMTKEEMNKINEKTEDLEVLIAPQHKFNGCGLVISSEVVKSGVNIPKSVFFVHEDTAFMHMTNKILGNIPQYIIKNILLVHNRNHPKKRRYIKNEKEDGTMNEKRRSNEWYIKANKMSEENCYNIFNLNYKSFTWNDVWK
tara:strand:+ start:444 stop:1400 length:957 start_codon:yes stop_codon:yes gene_type:complete